MKLTIYLDMDGVLCDFNKEYIKVIGVPPSLENRDKKERDEKWLKFINTKSFENLDYFKDAKVLLKVIKLLDLDSNVNVEILSSAGGALHYDEVKAQKVKWLKDHNVPYEVNIVKHRSKKKYYANEYTLLIDDTDDVIDSFGRAGGKTILHKGIIKTIIKLLKVYLEFKIKRI